MTPEQAEIEGLKVTLLVQTFKCEAAQNYALDLEQQVAALRAEAARGHWFAKHAYLAFDEDIPAWVLRLDAAIVPDDRTFPSVEARVDAAIDAAMQQSSGPAREG